MRLGSTSAPATPISDSPVAGSPVPGQGMAPRSRFDVTAYGRGSEYGRTRPRCKGHEDALMGLSRTFTALAAISVAAFGADAAPGAEAGAGAVTFAAEDGVAALPFENL